MKHTLKFILRTIVEAVTRKHCDKCKHCLEVISCDNYQRYCNCVSGIYPKGFEKSKHIKE